MRFSVDIFELVTGNDYALIAGGLTGQVGYDNFNAVARLHDDTGAVTAEMSTYDDNPIEIGDEYIKIDGVLRTHRTTADGYGYWLCRPHRLYAEVAQ